MRTTWLVICFIACCFDSRAAAAPRSAPPPRALASASASAETEAAKRYQESYDLEATGKTDAALDALNRLPSVEHQSYVAELRRGWLLYRLGRHDDAATAYGLAIALAPAAIEPKVGVLAPLIALRRWSDVEATARAVLRMDPANYSATLRLAYATYNMARFIEAEAAYRALVGLYPSDVDARAGLGWSLLKQGRKSDATKAFAALLLFAPRNALALEGARACQ
jgi:tetratricopeptide (TPR) repeat protein